MSAFSPGPVEADMRRHAAVVRDRLRGKPVAAPPPPPPPLPEFIDIPPIKHAPAAMRMWRTRRPPVGLRAKLVNPAVPADFAGVLEESRAPTLSAIKSVVAKRMGTTVVEIVSHRRFGRATLARQVVMYLARELTTSSLPEIGRALGKRDHTTVLHGCRKISALVVAGDPIAADIAAIREAIGCAK